MEKLKFEFVVKTSENPKTNVICITSIMKENEMFLIPEKLQPVKLHDAVTKTHIFQKYGNIQFKGYLLEEITSTTQQQDSTKEISTEALTKILQNLADFKRESRQPNLKKLSEQFVLEKFTKKTSSVTQWMFIFEAECSRIGVDEEIEKIQVFRLFLEDSCLDWYNSMLIKHTINSEWCIWKKSFCETYVNKGWTPIRYAFLFKYRQGSLLEYAPKKERLLLEINKLIDGPTLIDLIVTGLPNFIVDEIDRHKLKDTEDLFSNIRGLEHLLNKKIVEKRGIESESKIKQKNVADQPCRICEKERNSVSFRI
ncbi:hypothetical protein WA026_019464, partial [Henosepilachna vigintioctopunctata]